MNQGSQVYNSPVFTGLSAPTSYGGLAGVNAVVSEAWAAPSTSEPDAGVNTGESTNTLSGGLGASIGVSVGIPTSTKIEASSPRLRPLEALLKGQKKAVRQRPDLPDQLDDALGL